MEKRLEPVRHVEVQFVGDGEGAIAHLFERECSLQRRHQKVLEESPAARLSPALRAALVASTKAIAQAAGYRGAGTAEFLVDAAGKHYFLEINARIQVEHPVTELVTGVDLVALQLDVAEGRGLPAGLEPAAGAEPHGHAVEARLYAEDPAHDFLPQSGRIAALRLPGGPGVRVDTGVRAGDEVGLHFDPMIAKICAWAPTRAAALERLAAALKEADVAGVVTNLPFLRALLADAAVQRGELTTSLIEQRFAPAWRATRKARPLGDARFAAVALAAMEGPAALRATAPSGVDGAAGEAPAQSPWQTLAGFRVAP
jgi:acetyl/propionyl-CoA carboxylase alpha subunit